MKKSKIRIVANWKQNPLTPVDARDLFQSTVKVVKMTKHIQVIVCPPAPFLPLLKQTASKNVCTGVQDISADNGGAHTGEIAPAMVVALGAQFSIVGHSERRAQGESDALVSRKVQSALHAGLSVIVCVGERERDAHGNYFEVLKQQVEQSLSGAKGDDVAKLIVAYEPVWAIGKSFADAMKPRDVHETMLYIRKVLSGMYGQDLAMTVPILYGGSVNFENAGAIVHEGEVAGLLVGRESVSKEGFKKLIQAIDVF